MPRAFLLQKRKRKVEVLYHEDEQGVEVNQEERSDVSDDRSSSSPMSSASCSPAPPEQHSPRTPGCSPAKPDAEAAGGARGIAPFRSSENSAFSRIQRSVPAGLGRETQRTFLPYLTELHHGPSRGSPRARARSASPQGAPAGKEESSGGHRRILGPFGELPGYPELYPGQRDMAALMRYGLPPPPPINPDLLGYTDLRLPVTHYYLNMARMLADRHNLLRPPPAHTHGSLSQHLSIQRHHPLGIPAPSHIPTDPYSPRGPPTTGCSSPPSTPPFPEPQEQSLGGSVTVLSVPVLPHYPAIGDLRGVEREESPPRVRLLGPAHPGQTAGAAAGMMPTAWLGGLAGLTAGRPRDPSKPPVAKKYKCDVCGKAFSRSNTLVTHKRIHTGEKPFVCETCGRAFRQPGNLTRHRLTHTTVKPYVCARCGKAFNRASNLHTHMRTHTNYKPFVCTYCGKGFHQKIDMKIHSYTHTGMCGRLQPRSQVRADSLTMTSDS